MLSIRDFFIYLFIMAGVTYLIRALPLVIFKGKITNRFVQSFLYYVPYAVLGAMTFPSILFSTGNLAFTLQYTYAVKIPPTIPPNTTKPSVRVALRNPGFSRILFHSVIQYRILAPRNPPTTHHTTR